ncbi:MAG: ABC transporter permease [Microbacterium sp.]
MATGISSLVLGRRIGAPRLWHARSGTRVGIIVAIAWLALVLTAAFFPTLLTSVDPLQTDPAAALQAPSWAHPLGTDNIGRDMLSRVIHGAGLSLQGSAIATVLALVVGSLIGLLSGAVGGIFDSIVMRFVDVLLAIPGLLLSMAVVTALGFGTINVAIAVGVGSVAVFARLMRAEVVRVVGARYIEAARLAGSGWFTVLRRHVLPNSAGSVLTLAALEFGTSILAISALSFLGYGAQPPTPEWGSLISTGRNFMTTAWWLTVGPGLVIVFTVLAANRISRALDPEQEVIR